MPSDIIIAKNYLNGKELEHLNRIGNMYLDYAEMQASRRKAMTMKDWVKKLNAFLKFSEYEILTNAGKISREIAEALAQLRRRCPEKKLVAEAVSINNAVELAGYGVDVLQLEKFTPEEVAACRDALAGHGQRPLLAVAGGVTVANVVGYAQAGADLLVTSAPYFASPADIKVTISRSNI